MIAARIAGSLRTTWRSIAAFHLFGTVALVILLAENTRNTSGAQSGKLVVGLLLGILAAVVGQVVAILRLRIGTAAFACAALGFLIVILAIFAKNFEVVAYGSFAIYSFACGYLSLQHGFEIVAASWGAFGWIGAMIFHFQARRSHASADGAGSGWDAETVVLVVGFVATFLLYLSTKQWQRVAVWQEDAAPAARQAVRAGKTKAPRAQLGVLILIGGLLAGLGAVVGPLLLQTEAPSLRPRELDPNELPDLSDLRDVRIDPKAQWRDDLSSENALERMMRGLLTFAEEAKNTVPGLWPLLVLLVFYRPLKRAFVLRQLRLPIFATPPTEQIENLWEYLRIVLLDAGVAVSPSDSAEDLIARAEAKGLAAPRGREAAALYARARHGFGVRPGDLSAMRAAALTAAAALRKGTSPLRRVGAWWRGLD